jgi:hypothetical protein
MNSFTETQRFDQWWLKVLLAIPIFECLAFALNDYQTNGEISMRSLIGMMTLGAVVLLLWALSLTTRVDEEGIQYRFFPFHLRTKHLKWNEIASAVIREYRPLREYGGWGIRLTFGNGVAYNVKGNIGLQLVLKNGKKILIGTSEQQRLHTLLEELKKTTTISALN